MTVPALHSVMGAFSLYVRLSDDEGAPTAEDVLASHVDAHDSVDYERADIDDDQNDPGVSETGLDIGDIEAFASVVVDLKDTEAVEAISLWGPGSERYPVEVYHYALRNLSDPDRYQFHALDDRVTLLICDTPAALRQAKDEIGPAGLVEGGEAKF